MSEARAKRVLVADDSLTARAFVCEVLRDSGYEVLDAGSGEEALEVARDAIAGEGLDLLVTDVLMPRMKGPELARRLLDLRPGLRVLVISGYTGEEQLDDLLRGADARFLAKPLSPGDLVSTVAELLDGAE